MSGGLQELRVFEEDHGGDAVAFDDFEQGITYLFVRPNQSFDNAVRKVCKACPELSVSRAQDLIRVHCRSIIEMNERLGADQVVPRFEAAPDAGVVPLSPMKATGQHRRPRPPRWAKAAAVAAPALAGGMLLAQWLHPSTKPVATTTTPSISQDDKAVAGTYRSPIFEKIADGGEMKCDPVGAYEAKCVDADGKVMYSEASVGTSTAFTFSYDREKVGFRLFSDTDAAEAWAAEDANQSLYHNVRQYGRVVLWGTDAGRLRGWGQALNGQEAQTTATTFVDPLPDRLAFLAFGTLGVTEKTIQQAVGAKDAEAVQLLRAIDLVLGSASGSQFGMVPSGPNDAVAVVADAPETDGPRAVPHGGFDPAPVETPTGIDAGTPKPAAPDTAPPVAEAPGPAVEPEQAPIGPDPEPEIEPEPAPTDPAPEPEPEIEPGPEAEAPATETPQTETPPALPITEEPDDDGLSLDTMPAQWAA